MSHPMLFQCCVVDSIESYYTDAELQGNWRQLSGDGGTDNPTIENTFPHRGFQSCELESARPSGTPFLMVTFSSQDFSDYTHLFFASRAENITSGDVRVYDNIGDYDTATASYTETWYWNILELPFTSASAASVTSLSFEQASNSSFYIDDIIFFKSDSDYEDRRWVQAPSKQMSTDESVNIGGVPVAGQHGMKLNISSANDGVYTLDVFLPKAYYNDRLSAYQSFKNAGMPLILITDDVVRPVVIKHIEKRHRGGKDTKLIDLKLELRENNAFGVVDE
jgi:hypothetical protein